MYHVLRSKAFISVVFLILFVTCGVLFGQTVTVPTAISGPAVGFVDQNLDYTASGSISDDGDDVEYRFDWGDGSPVSAWGTADQTYAYPAPGTFDILAQARGATNLVESAWSAPLKTVQISYCVLTVTVDPVGAGTVIQAPPPDYTYDQDIQLLAVPNPDYAFARWQGDATGTDNPVDLTMDDNKDVTAAFVELVYFFGTATIDGVNAEIGDEIRIFDPDGVQCGLYVVDTPGQYGPVGVSGDNPSTPEDEGALPGEMLEFRIFDLSENTEFSGFMIFLSGDAPQWTAVGDIWNVDVAAATPDGPVMVSNMMVILDNRKPNRDQFRVGRAYIPDEMMAAGFVPAADVVTVGIDGSAITIPAGSFVRRGTRPSYMYNSPRGVLPRVSMKIDYSRRLWSLRIRRAALTRVDNTNGVGVTLFIGTAFFGADYVMDEVTRWNYSARRNTFVPLAITGTPFSTFAIRTARGVLDSERVGNNKLDVRGFMVLPIGQVFNLGADTVAVGMDYLTFTMPPGSFIQRGFNPIYSYKDVVDHQVTETWLDFKRARWSFRYSRGEYEGLRPDDGVDLNVIIGNDVGGYAEANVRLNVTRRTKLKYRE